MVLRYFILAVFFICSTPFVKGECRKKEKEKDRYDAYLERIGAYGAKRALLVNRTRTDLINYLIEKNGYESYLEIGVASGDNLKLIKIPKKVGVDPSPSSPCEYHLTSDDFFNQNKETFDIIFIDGLHLHEQVLRDVDNALTCLNEGGVIVMHDCMPAQESWQSRTPVPGAWNGDVWKAAAYIRMHYDNVHFCVLDMDHGCGVLTPNSSQILYPELPISQMTWDFFVRNRNALLNVLSVEYWISSNN